MQPKELLYSKTHEWVRVQDNRATIGITDHAQSELGDIVFVELPNVGTKIQAGMPFGTVESIKTVSDLVAPISGEVIEVNSDLNETPELVNEDPYHRGWMLVIEMSNRSELDQLKNADEYEDFIRQK
ncbi:MAG: glycine cleavage system protein GcvH [Armatimonadetes bacterium]|nr:glycine cleavage system protein GcvH [Armatimonadota bacterium]